MSTYKDTLCSWLPLLIPENNILAFTAIDRGSITIAKRGGGIRHPWHGPRESLHVQYFACWTPNFKLNMTGEYSELTTEEYSTEGRKCLVYKENNLYVSKNCEHKQSMGENLHGSIHFYINQDDCTSHFEVEFWMENVIQPGPFKLFLVCSAQMCFFL